MLIGFQEYAGFLYEVHESAGARFVNPVAGQHKAAAKAKHCGEALAEYEEARRKFWAKFRW